MNSLSDSLTVAQVAQSQGVCTKTVRKWCLMEEDPLPSYKVGNVRRVRQEALLTWIQKREQGGTV
ncbi:helix-turn-helix domain-containing protein [Paenibacillus sp. SSG-1]|uniref:helix-turn-helix domain-containing protein n=1 Tax=Paenibacillus sp. SSG-1 TaxID=1443669 RepID=UPI000B7C83DE|nr:helix-turn-helix domain-containing protein [Paenibacillus sp. SSG-1]